MMMGEEEGQGMEVDPPQVTGPPPTRSTTTGPRAVLPPPLRVVPPPLAAVPNPPPPRANRPPNVIRGLRQGRGRGRGGRRRRSPFNIYIFTNYLPLTDNIIVYCVSCYLGYLITYVDIERFPEK